jgi:hypothetical protein
LKNGTIGALEATLGEDEAFTLWEEEGNQSAVSVIKTATFADYRNHIVLARDDGTIEIYFFNKHSLLDLVF